MRLRTRRAGAAPRADGSPTGREIVVHVGLPKTATTTIQTVLSWYADDFANAGVNCRSVEPHAAHHLLADALLRLDGGGWPVSFHDSPWDLEGCWPDWGDARRMVISAEDLMDIGPTGVTAVDAFAEQHDATITVVATLRSPVEWSWSLWTECTKSRPIDWIEFLENLIECRRGLIGVIEARWSAATRFRSLELLDFHRSDLVLAFLDRCAAPGIVGPEVVATVDENPGVDALEAMYRAAYVATVLDLLATDGRFTHIDPDPGLVARVLLAADAWSSPMADTARAFAGSVESLAGDPSSPFGPDSLPVLQRFCAAVAEDAADLAVRPGAPLGDESRSVLRAHAERARVAASELRGDGGPTRRFPNRDFRARLPVDARFHESARQAAGLVLSAVVLADRTRRSSRRPPA